MTCCFDPIAFLWTLFQSLHHTWCLNKSTGSIPKRWEGSDLPVSRISGQEALEEQEKPEQTPLWILQITFVCVGSLLMWERSLISALSGGAASDHFRKGGGARVCWQWSLLFLLNEIFIGFVCTKALGRWQGCGRFALERVDDTENK